MQCQGLQQVLEVLHSPRLYARSHSRRTATTVGADALRVVERHQYVGAELRQAEHAEVKPDPVPRRLVVFGHVLGARQRPGGAARRQGD